MFKLLPILIILLLIPTSVFARTTPEDIVNSQKAAYNTKVSKYSSENTQKLENMEVKIAEFNKQKTDLLTVIMERQSQVLEEYARRKGTSEVDSREFQNARYWLTYAHEAVAFQAAKIYVFNLTSEKNVSGDINFTINQMQADLNTLRGKVIKSQNIIKNLVSS